MRIGSLFSGYGGLDMGVRDVLGGEVSWHVEYEKAPSAILAHHWPEVPNHGDVTAVDFRAVEPVDVLTGGYPCQPFSHAGNRKGTDDRRHLWPHVLRAIRELGPRLVVLENVRGHLTLGFDTVLADLASVGWSAEWGLVRASDTGACHQRARLFIVAYPERERHDGRGVTGPTGRPGGWWPYVAGLAEDAADAQLLGLYGGAVGRGVEQSSGERGLRQSEGRYPPAHAHPDIAGGEARGDTGHDGNRVWVESVGSAPLAADTSGQRHGTREDVGLVGRMGAPSDVVGRQTGSPWEVSGDRGSADAADPYHPGRIKHGRPVATGPELPTAQYACGAVSDPAQRWGNYAASVQRWERVTGRPAPSPTQPGRDGAARLSPLFVEWMMGLEPGHVTDPAIGISHNDQLKALGNGVVPQQAAHALRLLLPRIADGA